VALATFCGYAFANTVGLSLVSGGSVRYRVYVSAGLDAADVARVTVFSAVGLGIGLYLVAAAALIVHPDLVAFAGACLYVLLPAPVVPFLAFLGVYAVAVTVGLVSHVPGGLGVF
jgi:phosphatidylglycerol lysyltransferase